MYKCLLDLDGVLVSLVEGISKAHNFMNPWHDEEHHGKYFGSGKMCELWKITDSKLWSVSNAEFWAGLDPMPDYKEILEKLELFFGRKNICILSNPTCRTGYIEECAEGKIRWIKEYIPQYEYQFLLGPAKQFCANKYSVLIDDYDSNVNKFRDHGGKAFLVPRPWNSAYPDRYKVIEKLDEFLWSLE